MDFTACQPKFFCAWNYILQEAFCEEKIALIPDYSLFNSCNIQHLWCIVNGNVK